MITKMNIKTLLKLLCIYLCAFIVGTAFFILLFYTPVFSNMDVLFYRGILLLIVASACTSVLLFLLKKYKLPKWFTIRDILLCICILFSFNLLFFTHVPVTAERSISIFTLGYFSQNSDKLITEKEMQDYFIKKYVNEYGAFKKRFHEQIVTGTIEASDDGYLITQKGKGLMNFYDFIADLFHIKKDLIQPMQKDSE